MLSGLKDISDYDHDFFMEIAIKEAEIAGNRGDKPIAAVLVHDHMVIGKMSNNLVTRNSKVHHAENHLVMENAQFLRSHGTQSIIYSTLEPCLMCISTIIMADIRNVVIGHPDRYMQTQKFIESHDWLKDRLFNYLIGIKLEECRMLIEKYGDDRDREILI